MTRSKREEAIAEAQAAGGVSSADAIAQAKADVQAQNAALAAGRAGQSPRVSSGFGAETAATPLAATSAPTSGAGRTGGTTSGGTTTSGTS